MLEALNGAADTIRRDGVITGTELGNYLRETTPVVARLRYNRELTPQFGALDTGSGDFLFIPPQRLRDEADRLRRERARLEKRRKKLEGEKARLERERLTIERARLDAAQKALDAEWRRLEEEKKRLAALRKKGPATALNARGTSRPGWRSAPAIPFRLAPV